MMSISFRSGKERIAGDHVVNKEPVLVARPPLLRQTNAQLLLRLLRGSGPCSKADLVRASGLSAPTVTNVVGHLASVGLIEPVGEGDSTGGRPPDIIRFRAERGCVAGVEIGSDALHFLLADLDGHELTRASAAVTRNSSKPSAICSQIVKELRNLTRKQKRADEQLLGVGVGVPSIVNVDKGTVLALSALKGWNQVPLRSLLTRELKCQVAVDNDTNLAALGEYNRGAAQGESNFVFITIGEGVGAGIFLDGKLYRGSHWSAGEIGYLRIPHIAREHPAIRQYGRLEKILGASGILRSWRAASKQARSKSSATRPADVFDLAIEGNARAKKILLNRATILSDIILDLALILNPSLILLGGEVGGHPRLLQEVKALLKGSEFAMVRVLSGALGPSAVLWGAAHTAMESALLSLLQPPD
jgi:glucokinase